MQMQVNKKMNHWKAFDIMPSKETPPIWEGSLFVRVLDKDLSQDFQIVNDKHNAHHSFVRGYFSSESVTVTLHPKDNIIIIIKPAVNKPKSPSCMICTPKDGCNILGLQINPGMTVTYTFSCPAPEKYFKMEITRVIDCHTGLCPFGNVDLQPSNLIGLNRTFSWRISMAQNIGLELNFSTPWLSQINSSLKCPDLVTFTISTTISGSSVNVGTFCRHGTVSRVKLLGGGVVTLELPWNETLTQSGFSIANRSSIQRLCIIESTFQSESSVTMMSANYPAGFPDDDLMTWQFILPPNHRASVEFLNYSSPTCEKKFEQVEYFLPNFYNNREVLKLEERQPANIAGNFNLSLQNCKLDIMTPRPLNLLFKVTVQKTPSQANITYHVDLSGVNTMNVLISRRLKTGRSFAPVCFICRGYTDCYPELSLAGGRSYRIYFYCETLDILMVTAEKVIECSDLKTCTIRNTSLVIPQSLIRLPVRLESVSWKLIPPPQSNAEIGSRSIKLHQPLPGKPCNETSTDFSYGIIGSINTRQFNMGTFCPNGSLEKIQTKGNITITLNPKKNANLSSLLNHDLYTSFVPSIKDECIFTLRSKSGSVAQLHTPDWESGLPDYAYLSWSVDLAPKQFAKLSFDMEKMNLTCQMNSALLHIKEKKAYGISVLRNENEKLPSTLDLYNPFWVNISNCKPKASRLQMQFSIFFYESNSDLKIIVIAVVCGVAAVILIITVTLCCIRKKKKEKSGQLGIYNSKVNTEMPSRKGFMRKGRKKNESHIYAVIDDTMIYGHLLKHPSNPATPEVDVYQPFEGAMGDTPPVPLLPILNGSTKEETLEDPLACSMRLNEIYTFSEHIPKEPVEDEDTSLSFVDCQGPVAVPSA
ncbi:CUB domain-containing protein 1 [Pelodytes ibericus]